MTDPSDKLLVLARAIAKDALLRHPRDLRNQADEVESASYLAVVQAIKQCPCLANDRPTYPPLARVHAYSLLERELIRSCLLPVRLKDGRPISNWLGDLADRTGMPGLAAELLDTLNDAVASLNADGRELLYELWVEGRSMEDMASDRKVRPDTIKGRVNKLLKRMVKCMGKGK